RWRDSDVTLGKFPTANPGLSNFSAFFRAVTVPCHLAVSTISSLFMDFDLDALGRDLSSNFGQQGKNHMSETKYMSKWTVMVYFAADNDLDDVAFENLRQIKQAGSNSRLN